MEAWKKESLQESWKERKEKKNQKEDCKKYISTVKKKKKKCVWKNKKSKRRKGKFKGQNWGLPLPLSSEGNRVPLQNTCKIDVSTFSFFNQNSWTVTFFWNCMHVCKCESVDRLLWVG